LKNAKEILKIFHVSLPNLHEILRALRGLRGKEFLHISVSEVLTEVPKNFKSRIPNQRIIK